MGDQASFSDHSGRLNSLHRLILASVVAAASAQNGVLSLAQLLALGATRRQVQEWSRTGRLFRIHRGIYSLGPPSLLTSDGRHTAAVLAGGDGALISVRAAASLLELRKSTRTAIDITLPGRGRKQIRGVDVHYSTTLIPADITRVRGIPCTSIPRTTLDCASVLSHDQLKQLFEQQEAMDCFDLVALQGQIDRAPKRPAAARLTEALSDYTYGFGVPFSWLERALRAAIGPYSEIPEPLVNRWIDLDDGQPMIRADFHWPEFKIVVESDSDKYHRAMGKRERDYRNRQRLMVAGWRPLPLTYRQITQETDRMTSALITMIRATTQ